MEQKNIEQEADDFFDKQPCKTAKVKSAVMDGWDSLLADYRKLRRAAKCIRRRHDSGPDGMVVSSDHVRELWKVLDETQE